MPRSVDTYMTVQPDGSILFDFQGHVHAQGLDLDAAPVAAGPPAVNSVRWLDAANGALIASVVGSHAAAGAQNSIIGVNAFPEAVGESALVNLTALNDAGTTAEAGIQIGRAGTKDIGVGAGVDRIHAFVTKPAGFDDVKILDGNGGSDFLQLYTGNNVRRAIQFGNLGPVNSDGGGWLNFTFPTPFTFVVDALLVSARTGGANFGVGIIVSEVVDIGHFRCFINAAAQNVAVSYLAIGR
jgi:hypothetical protein